MAHNPSPNRPVRFRMMPQDDLSERTDFTYSVTQNVGDEVKSAIDNSTFVAELRNKANVEVKLSGSLIAMDVYINITPREDMPEEEIQEAKNQISGMINSTIQERFGAVLQRSIDESRRRM